MELINGKQTASAIKEEIRQEVVEMKNKGEKAPCLAAIIVGKDPASETYVTAKVKACEYVGFNSTKIELEATITEEKLLAKIEELNSDDSIDGFIVQLPLPKHISTAKVTKAIDPEKDVDGFHPYNLGKMMLGEPTLLPATPSGIVELLKRYEIQTSGKKVAVIGRSNIVGTPMSLLLSRKARYGDATVTLCHSGTKNIDEICSQSDIIIAAVGVPHYLKANMVKEGAVVIDVGIHRVKSDKTKSGFRLIGDVDFEKVAPKCSYITPVPGGVGPMTIVSLLKNTLQASKGF